VGAPTVGERVATTQASAQLMFEQDHDETVLVMEQLLWQNSICARVDLSSIKAIAHDGSCLQVLLETANGYSIESLSAPEQAFQGQQKACSFCFPYPINSQQ
jgi:hypothetical protein